MYLTHWGPERWNLTWGSNYWTAWTTTTTTLASSWGLLINIDSATGDIARTTAWFVEDEKYWIYLDPSTATSTIKFSTTTVKTWRCTIQFDTSVNAAGFPQFWNRWTTAPSATWVVNQMTKYGIPLKWSTKYRIYFPIETVNTGGAWCYIAYQWFSTTWTRFTNVTQLVAWTFNWIKVYEFTSNASDAYMYIGTWYQSWTTGTMNIDYNNFRIEEVVEPVANSLTSSSPSLVSFTAVGSTDNIDQSAASSNSNWSLNNTANYSWQSFVPTKSKLTWIVLQKKSNVGSFTWTMTVSIVNNNVTVPWSTVFATYTIPNATWNAIANDTDYVVNLPCNLTPWTTYWIRFVSSTSSATDYPRLSYNNPSVYASGWLAYWTDWVTYATSTNDLFFKTLYYKPTTNFKASQNNSTVSISADEDGFLDGSVINLTTGTYSYTDSFADNVLSTDNIYSSNKYPITISGGQMVLNGDALLSLPDVQPVMKVKLWGTASSMTVSATIRQSKIQYSYDNILYYDWVIQDTSWIILSTFTIAPNTDLVYLKFVKWSGSTATYCYVNDLSITASINVSSLSTLRNYPTNKDIIKQYSTTLGSATTSATYRATKWGFPAIEYSATEYQFLDVDTTATGSTVAFSELWTSYTTVADWVSLAITSTSTPNLFVRHNITANRIYLSSNDYNASSDKDWSLKQSVVYQVVQ